MSCLNDFRICFLDVFVLFIKQSVPVEQNIIFWDVEIVNITFFAGVLVRCEIEAFNAINEVIEVSIFKLVRTLYDVKYFVNCSIWGMYSPMLYGIEDIKHFFIRRTIPFAFSVSGEDRAVLSSDVKSAPAHIRNTKFTVNFSYFWTLFKICAIAESMTSLARAYISEIEFIVENDIACSTCNELIIVFERLIRNEAVIISSEVIEIDIISIGVAHYV